MALTCLGRRIKQKKELFQQSRSWYDYTSLSPTNMKISLEKKNNTMEGLALAGY